jgi:hypothetical protein
MNVNKRPQPLFSAVVTKGAACPVCGFTSYSRNGIHPQCARRHEDEKRMARLKSRQSRDSKSGVAPLLPQNVLKPCHKRCPQCRNQVHARKSRCGCGYNFFAANKPTATP